jgi:hypothetical protein
MSMKQSIALVPLAVLCGSLDAFAAPEISAVAPKADPSTQTSPTSPKANPTPPTQATTSSPKKEKKHRSPFEDCEPVGTEQESARQDCAGVVGLRASVTHANVRGSEDAVGLMFSAQGETYRLRELWSTRSVYHLAIGGGTAGFEGILLGGWAGGVRIPVTPSRLHGPVLRLGMYGYLRGNDAHYGSLLELPQIQVGYQYQRARTVIEVGATGGPVLVGRSRIADTDRRVLGSGFEYGGYLAVQLPWVRLGASVSRLPVKDRWDQPVDVAEGALCGHVQRLALCTDARITATESRAVEGNSLVQTRSFYGGLTLGVTGE